MNFKSETIWVGDNLDIMRGMNSSSVDLIYLDPPFNSNADYAAPIGSQAAGAAFKDTWTLSDIDVEWINLLENQYQSLYAILNGIEKKSDKAYLVYMAVRLIEMQRILKDAGNIYLHCDPTMSHYLKVVMDVIFGRGNFVNEIIWCYRGGGVPRKAFGRKHDIILYYSKDPRKGVFNRQYMPYSEASTTLISQRGGVSIDGRERNLERGAAMNDWWVDINSLQTWSPERLGYPTQKPLELLDRIIKASSNKGDMVFDPFCGCATTLVAADRLQRQWAGIDISSVAVDLVNDRISEDKGMFKVNHSDASPQRTDLGKLSSPKTHKKHLYGNQGGHCAGCKKHFEIKNLEVDHIIAKNKGGTDHVENLQLLCAYCNRAKGDRGMEYLMKKLNMRED